MATRPLGALDSVDPRKAWDHEAHDFTPWLADNLDRLAKEIGLELEREGTEVHVGPSPRGHRRPQPARPQPGAHREPVGARRSAPSALRWLNEHTGDTFAFFAVRVRVVRIGNSPLAPVFEVLERPNDWDRRVQDTVQSRELTELGRFRRDFWAHVSKRHDGEAPAGYARSNVFRRVEEAGRRVCQYIAVDGVGVYFTQERGESEEEALAAVGPSVKWLRAETQGAEMLDDSVESQAWGPSFLRIDTRDRGNWDRIADWLHERRRLYERALREAGSSPTAPDRA